MHAAVLFGVLRDMQHNRDFEGTLFGIFQPGEELNPGGASLVLAERPFEGYDIAAVIGEHVDARLEVGEIGICPGQFMASNDELRLYVNGRGGHAARRTEIDDTVTASQKIGTLGIVPGESADSAHLHFELLKNGKHVSPLKTMGIE
jgi:metal-dependent amidase/aminoacylase/carboxypeptidase family protein